MLNEYRCTRNAPYQRGGLGYEDLSARQGFYILASSQQQAWKEMARMFPKETREGFTVDCWQK